jgi:hypothetical protein
LIIVDNYGTLVLYKQCKGQIMILTANATSILLKVERNPTPSTFSPESYPYDYAVSFVMSEGESFLPGEFIGGDAFTWSQAEKVLASWAYTMNMDEDELMLDIADASLAFYKVRNVPDNRR